jgi:thermostable 8-oxoguanine DNA glycosylase
MEPHKTLDSSIEKFRPSLKDPREYFQKALAFSRQFYSEEMDQIASVKHEKVDEDLFFREYIWVVHATGFSAKAVGKFMPKLVDAYGYWDKLGRKDFNTAFERVKKVCNNPQKAKAIHSTAKLMADELDKVTWAEFRKARLSTPKLLQELSYIGPVTCFHLARNIGLLDCVKPDLHLIRLADHWKFKDCVTMCKAMGEGSGLPLGIVDLVVWYAASTFGTIDVRKEGQR